MEKNDIISDLSGVVAGTIVEASISTVAPGIRRHSWWCCSWKSCGKGI